MLDKTLQFGKRMMHHLSENISDNERLNTSNYQLLINLINVRLSLKWQPILQEYYFLIAASIQFVFSTSSSTSYIYSGYNNSTKNQMNRVRQISFDAQGNVYVRCR